MMACALVKDPVDAEDVDPLRRSHHTVNETRQALSLGRGNSAADLAATNWQNLSRVAASRKYFEKVVLPEALHILESHPAGADDPERLAHATMVAHAGLATTAIAMRAGNCGEHAEVATHLHARKLLPGKETVVMMEDPTGSTHEWAEMHNERGRDHHVIMDPWDKGSAVLVKHSTRAEPPPEAKSSAGPYVREDAPAIKQAMAERWKTVTTRDAQALAMEIRKPVPQAHRDVIAPMLQEPQSVLHPSFIDKAAAQLQPPGEPERRPGQQALNQEVMAAGVARSMGVSINQTSAKTALPPIIQAARQLVAEGQMPQAAATAAPATPARHGVG